MRPLTATCLLLLAWLCAGASGQAVARTNSAPGSAEVLAQVSANPDRAAKLKEINERSAKYYAECVQSWDAGTQMTKQEWARTCRRVADERTKFLLDQSK